MIYKDKNLSNSSESLEELYLDEEQANMPTSPLSGKLKGVISHEYFYDKYIKSDMASAEFDRAVETLRETPEALSYMLDLNNASLYTFENSLLGLINNFTTEDKDPVTLALLISSLKIHSKIKDINQSSKAITIELQDGTTIQAQNMAKTIGLKDKDLASFKRQSKAHQMSVTLARSIPNARVVTGKVAGLTSKSSYLHSWVETTTSDGKTVVFDYTMNAIMNKNGYYSLRHAKQISAINGADITADIEKVAPFINAGELSGIEYLIHRESIMEALKENEQ